MISIKTFLVCLVLVAGIAAAPYEKDSETEIVSHVSTSGEIPTVVAFVEDDEHQVHEFRAPHYNADEKDLPEDFKDFSVDVTANVMGPIRGLIDSALIKGRSLLFLAPELAFIGTKFFLTALGYISKYYILVKKHNIVFDDNFLADSQELAPKMIKEAKRRMEVASKEATKKYDDIIEKARESLEKADKINGRHFVNKIYKAQKRREKAIEEDNKKYESKEARIAVGKKLLLIMDGCMQLIENSPVGMRLSFKDLTIDGKLMTEEAIESIQFMLRSGLGRVIDVIDVLFRKLLNEPAATAAVDGS